MSELYKVWNNNNNNNTLFHKKGNTVTQIIDIT